MNEDTEAEAAARSRRISRRSLLIGAGGIGLATGGFAVGTATGVIKLNPVWTHTISSIGQLPAPTTSTDVAAVGQVTTTVANVYSRTRGANLNLVTFLPGHLDPATLPVVLLLPGTPGDPRRTVPGLSEALATEAATGGRPFAVVALDGGDGGWHQQQPGADPMDVLVDELPDWLAAHSLRGVPVAVAGIGMGGFDALLYARRRNERHDPVTAVATVAPGLATSWPQVSSRHTFLNSAQWESLDPLRHIGDLGRAAIGVWCGDRDPNRAAIEEFVTLAHPQVVDIGRPGHSGTNFRSTLADVLRFLARNLPGSVRG